ncbi:hypothetical protein [Microbulbifer sp.]|uniref:hypothetical protein n=1 Tax=Microbulbifer sp. TaxID=1908541 RepID=UPI003F3C3DFC
MDWLQRYVDNVKTYLPGGMREDVGSELYSDLRDQCDDMAESLGRAPTEAEVLGLLKRKGHPMEVAAAYRPRRTLVSEALFPLYIQVLKWVFLAVIIANGVVIALGLFSQPEPDFTRAALHWLTGTFDAGLHSFAWVTLGFYLTGESISYSDFFGKWDPRKLPRIADPDHRISQFESAAELVAILLFMAWLNDVFTSLQGGTMFVFSDGVQTLLPWLNIAAGLSILMALGKLSSPYWTRGKLVADAFLNAGWLLLLALLFNLEQVFTFQWGDTAAEQWEMPLKNWRIITGILLVITAWDLLKNVRLYLRSPG